ncbi:helix-turn-helix domain-containing protein [Halobacillus sp. A5]|uniref:helix-turn-helix domain-containing protein n=1 Tax=Halobacillus sp. A5 TaxID=2880263 RepID=UPI0020A689CF|nr:helix-turn-helix domain-containing protein [Halobacillus sp. A5]MCP3026966.1 helix-turn-helix domain-containing protein [Halobacillus sp. A5]
MDILLALGIAAAGYFIGEGLKNFKNPSAPDFLSKFDDDLDHQLVKEKDIHVFLGVSKEDGRQLIQDHPEIPHITINQNIYYPKEQLKAWVKKIGN